MKHQKLYNENRFMEFLDPESKRARTLRLFAGYFLASISIGLAALILVYIAQGYNYNPTDGVRRDGLLFVDAKPKPANITLNGDEKGRTDSRLVLAEGVYKAELSSDKYRSWQKNIKIEGGTVSYLLYPRLFPVDIPITVSQNYESVPAWTTQSPDRRWLVVKQKANDAILTLYDLEKLAEEPVQLSLPFPLASDSRPVEWSTDNKHLLMAWTEQTLTRYAVIDREKVSDTIDLNPVLKITQNSEVVLRNKRPDQFYVRDINSGDIRSATLNGGQETNALVAGATAFKAYGSSTLFYVTNATITDQSLAALRVYDDGKTYNLQPIQRDPEASYLLDTAKFKGNWYFVAASNTAALARVYINPLSRVAADSGEAAKPQLSMRLANPKFVSFSDNARFIALQSGSNFVAYDAEQKTQFKYSLPFKIDDKLKAPWMDGHRLRISNASKTYVFEFDGTNRQELGSSYDQFVMYFDPNYENGFTIRPSVDGRAVLAKSDLVID